MSLYDRKFDALLQLTWMYGESFDYLYGEDEDAAFRDFLSSNENWLAIVLAELDEVIAKNPSEDAMREALDAHGVSIMLDGEEPYLSLARRLRARLVKALAETTTPQQPLPDGSA